MIYPLERKEVIKPFSCPPLSFLLNLIRSSSSNLALFQMISLLLGVIYLQQELDQPGIQNINGALFLLLTNMTFQNAFAVVNVRQGNDALLTQRG